MAVLRPSTRPARPVRWITFGVAGGLYCQEHSISSLEVGQASRQPARTPPDAGLTECNHPRPETVGVGCFEGVRSVTLRGLPGD
jgi:hypothetical protein